MLFRIHAVTHPGLIRGNNEDAVAFDDTAGLCILADGMGGHNAGEVASGMAATFIKSELGKWLHGETGKDAGPAELETALAACVAQANQAIYNIARGNPQYAGMGTTLVAGVFREQCLALAHIGDSRCYRLRGGQFRQITKDHSFRQEQADSGYVPQPADSPFQNTVTRALGVTETAEPEIHLHDVAVHDLYLMCSDGLSDMVDESRLAAILMSNASLAEKAEKLVAAANEAGGRDNISVLLVEVDDSGAKPGLLSSMKRALRGAIGKRQD